MYEVKNGNKPYEGHQENPWKTLQVQVIGALISAVKRKENEELVDKKMRWNWRGRKLSSTLRNRLLEQWQWLQGHGDTPQTPLDSFLLRKQLLSSD